jgi:hypothetical protein
MGTLAFVCLRFIPARFLVARLFLVLVTAFSWFWEGGYLMRAMHRRDGDLYFFAQFLLGEVAVWQRCIGALLGLALYVVAAWVTSRQLLKIWPQAVARRVARIAWLGATAGAAIAALAYPGHDWGDLRDGILEIGAASFPLLFISLGKQPPGDTQPPMPIVRSPITIVLSIVIYVVFVATLGRGMVE